MKASPLALAIAVLPFFPAPSVFAGAADGGMQTLVRADRPGEGWFGAATVLGGQTPFGLRTGAVEFDQTSFALYNQAAPLMLSTQGGWVWSEEPLVCSYTNGTWRYRSRGTILSGTAKEGTLAGAYAEVSRRFFPPSGRSPDELFVRAPQYNTWIELGHDQTQEKILAYARDVVTNGFPAGVLMIDHGWQREFGDWRFRPEAFPDPKRMMDELHALGFRTLLWVVPFVSTNAPAYAELKRKGALLADGSGAPAPITWWSGTDAVLDLREKAAGDWFRGELKRLAALGTDGFKLDGGDPEYYDPVRYGLPAPARDPECARQSELWARLGLEWPFNELRATWKCGGLPLVERLCDKGANMAAVRELIPSLVNLGLMGHPFACPDMIGGGMLTVFRENKFNPEVYVRSAQVHALSPMMQFSASPWRRLDAAHLAAVRKAVAIRQRHADYLVRTMRESAKTGLPMIRSLEFVFPGRGYACVNDQFMLGEDLMVAPQMKDGARKRTVRIPPGTWRADDGTVTKGPCEMTVSTPLDRLPHYGRVCDGGRPPVIVNEPAEHFFVASTRRAKGSDKGEPDLFADLWSFPFPDGIDLSERGVERYVDALAGGRLTHLFINVNYMRSYCPSKVIEPVWTSLDEPGCKPNWFYRDMRDAFARGLDVYAVMVRRCRERGASPWLSFRMNDVHGVAEKADADVCAFWREHPEYRLQRDRRTWSNGFDYAQKPVRDRMAAYIREMLERYDADGVELDFLRFPNYFRPGTERASAPMLTEFLREIRATCDAAAKRRGHPVRIAVRLMSDPERVVAMGADVGEWTRGRMVDMLIVCNMYDTIKYEYHLDDWRRLVGEGVPIVTGTDNGIVDGGRRRVLKLDEYRNWMELMRRKGADGTYFFNFPLRPFCDATWRGLLGER